MLPASLAAAVPVFIATPTSACASAGASLVPSPVIATSRPPSCSLRISAILSSGVASARKSSTPACAAIAFAVSGLSPVIITVRMPIARISANRSAMPGLTTSDSSTTPSTPGRRRPCRDLLGDDQRRPAVLADPLDVVRPRRHRGARRAVGGAAGLPSTTWPSPADGGRRPGGDGGAGALADRRCCPSRCVEPGHPGLRGERDELGGRLLAGRLGGQAVLACAQLDDAAALRRLVGQAGQPGRRGQLRHRHAGRRDQRGGPAVAEGDRAGLVEQQGVDVARGLDGPAGRGEHVALHEPVHPGDADGRQQRADRRRDEADQQRGEHHQRLLRAGVAGHRLQRDDGEQEDDRQRGQQDRQRDLVGRLLPLRALDQGDHPVDERLARAPR